MTDDINTYGFLSYDQELSPSLVNIDRKGLAYFLNQDQGYQGGIREYGYYIVAKVLDIKSEEDYMNHLTDMRLICNELWKRNPRPQYTYPIRICGQNICLLQAN